MTIALIGFAVVLLLVFIVPLAIPRVREWVWGGRGTYDNGAP